MDEEDMQLVTLMTENRIVYVSTKNWYYPDSNNIWCSFPRPSYIAYIKNLTLPYKMGSYPVMVKTFNKCKPYLHDPLFEDLLDIKYHLVPFKNGVFDLRTKQFRPIVEEDYISQPIDYEWCGEDNEAIQNEIRDFVRDIVGDREDIWKILRSLIGDTGEEKKIVVLAGGLWSGKDTLMSLLKNMIGHGLVISGTQKQVNKPPKKRLEEKVLKEARLMVIDTEYKQVILKCSYKNVLIGRHYGVIMKAKYGLHLEEGFGEENVEVIKCNNCFVGKEDVGKVRHLLRNTAYRQQLARMVLLG